MPFLPFYHGPLSRGSFSTKVKVQACQNFTHYWKKLEEGVWNFISKASYKGDNCFIFPKEQLQ